MLFSQVSPVKKVIVYYKNKAISGNKWKHLKIVFMLHGLLLFPLNVMQLLNFFFLSFFHLTEFREDSLKKGNHSVQQYE